MSIDQGLAGRREDLVGDVRRRLDQVDILFDLQPLLDHLHVQQAQKPAAEAEAQRVARFRHVGEAGVIQAELLQLFAQILEIGGVDRIHAAENHLLRLLITGERLGRRVIRFGDRVADVHRAQFFLAGDDVTHLAGPERVAGNHVRTELAQFENLVRGPRAHKAHFLARLQRTFLHAHIGDDAAIGVVLAVEDECPQRGGRAPRRCRDFFDDRLEDVVDRRCPAWH